MSSNLVLFEDGLLYFYATFYNLFKFQLQVPDEALSHVMDMGFKEGEAKRALRMCHQDVCKAVDFLFEERTKREKKREEDIERQKEIKHVFLAKLASIFVRKVIIDL